MHRATPWISLFTSVVFFAHAPSAQARDLPVVPGSGTYIDWVGDTFENPEWGFIHNLPKSSKEQDEQRRFPRGYSTNGRWFEGPERGHPDMMKVVPTPAGGLPGSNYSLLVRTRDSGIPGFHNRKTEQDDLIVDCVARLNGSIPVAEVPSAVVRVYLPKPEQWENRSGPHFGFRITTNCMITKTEEQKINRFRSRPHTYRTRDPYWPGIWIHFESETDAEHDVDGAFLAVRGNSLGHDFKTIEIPQEQFGWWTLGISVTGTGMVHYYASPGVDDLEEDDYITSQYPYQRQAERFETLFFNYCNRNDGSTWSTPFLIDDPRLYVVRSNRIASIVNAKKQHIARQAAAKQQAEMLHAQRAAKAARAAEQAMISNQQQAPTRTARRKANDGRNSNAPNPRFELNELYQ
jgi:hypothetical protein